MAGQACRVVSVSSETKEQHKDKNGLDTHPSGRTGGLEGRESSSDWAFFIFLFRCSQSHWRLQEGQPDRIIWYGHGRKTLYRCVGGKVIIFLYLLNHFHLLPLPVIFWSVLLLTSWTDNDRLIALGVNCDWIKRLCSHSKRCRCILQNEVYFGSCSWK